MYKKMIIPAALALLQGCVQAAQEPRTPTTLDFGHPDFTIETEVYNGFWSNAHYPIIDVDGHTSRKPSARRTFKSTLYTRVDHYLINGIKKCNFIRNFVPGALKIIEGMSRYQELYVPDDFHHQIAGRVDGRIMETDKKSYRAKGYYQLIGENLDEYDDDMLMRDYENSRTQLRKEFPFIIYTVGNRQRSEGQEEPEGARDAFTVYLQGYARRSGEAAEATRLDCNKVFTFERYAEKIFQFKKLDLDKVTVDESAIHNDVERRLRRVTIEPGFEAVESDRRRRLAQENRCRRLAHLNAEHKDRLQRDQEYLAKLALDQ